jgi:peptide deformylase
MLLSVEQLITDREILAKISQPVVCVDDENLEILAQMHQTMEDVRKRGTPIAALAANQIGHLRRIITLRSKDGFTDMFNPQIVSAVGRMKNWEACGSIPLKTCLVRRPEEIKVTFLDKCGDEKTMAGRGGFSIYVSHEIDHLDGKTILDRSLCTRQFDTDEQRDNFMFALNHIIGRERAERGLLKTFIHSVFSRGLRETIIEILGNE